MQKKPVLMLLACLALLAISAIPALAQSATESATESTGATFATPEDAITTFFDGLTQVDIDKIYSACAIDEIGENFKFDLTTDRLRSLSPAISLAPTNNPLFVQINKDQTRARIAMQVKLIAFSLLSSTPMDMSNVTLMDLAGAQKFEQDVDPAKLSGIKLLKIGAPSPSIMANPRYISNAKSSSATVGADDQTERVAFFSFNGNTYMLGFTLFNFGGDWKIYTVSSPLANTSSLGTPVQMSEADFDELTK